MSASPHALVVGGTGMLAGLTGALAERGSWVTVVARRPVELGLNVEQIAVDYRESDALRKRLAEAAQARGPIMLAVAWIHTDAPEAPRIVADALADGGRLVQVFGTRVWPLEPLPERVRYQQVLLGGVRDPSGFRWLTNREIWEGVLAALDADEPLVVVGELGMSPGRPALGSAP